MKLARRAAEEYRGPGCRHAPRSKGAQQLGLSRLTACLRPRVPRERTAVDCQGQSMPSRNLFAASALQVGVQQDPVASTIFCCVHGRIGTLDEVALEPGVLAEDCYSNTDAQMLDCVWRSGKKFCLLRRSAQTFGDEQSAGTVGLR